MLELVEDSRMLVGITQDNKATALTIMTMVWKQKLPNQIILLCSALIFGYLVQILGSIEVVHLCLHIRCTSKRVLKLIALSSISKKRPWSRFRPQSRLSFRSLASSLHISCLHQLPYSFASSVKLEHTLSFYYLCSSGSPSVSSNLQNVPLCSSGIYHCWTVVFLPWISAHSWHISLCYGLWIIGLEAWQWFL